MCYLLTRALSCAFVTSTVSADSWSQCCLCLRTTTFHWADVPACDLCCYHHEKAMPVPPTLSPVWNFRVHLLTPASPACRDVWGWPFLCICRECGERNLSGAVSHVAVYIGRPVLGPPVQRLHLCVHIPQPPRLPASAADHCSPEAEKHHLLQFLLPGVPKWCWELFHQFGSL